jgi:hypothetical protein
VQEIDLSREDQPEGSVGIPPSLEPEDHASLKEQKDAFYCTRNTRSGEKVYDLSQLKGQKKKTKGKE